MSYKYMIHTCKKRKWYVNQYLIPSMLEQGITKDQIIVMTDNDEIGILYATMQSFDWIGRTQDWSEIIWHLQDDVIISSNFKRMTDNLYGDIICGFCSTFDKETGYVYGLVDREKMWYSFPCIGIKNYFAKDCADWFFESEMFKEENREKIRYGKYADWFFRKYVMQYQKNIRVFNSNPNLVDHIDWLIGGSLVNSCRDQKQVRAIYWKEHQLVSNLQLKLTQTNV